MIDNFFKFLFIHFWLRWVFIVPGLSSRRGEQGLLELWCAGFSLQRLLLSWHVGSVVAAAQLSSRGSVLVVHGLSQSAGMWDLPRPGIELESPAWAAHH